MRRPVKIHPEKYYPIVARGEVDTCPICLDDITDLECKLTCSHKFHLYCIGKWLDDNTTCPVCRHVFSATPYVARDFVRIEDSSWKKKVIYTPSGGCQPTIKAPQAHAKCGLCLYAS